MDPAIRRVGVVGLGRMGEAFARNLIADGYGVIAYDRSKTRRDLLAGVGAKAASGLGDLAPCQVVLTLLPDDDALTDVALGVGGLIQVLAPEAIHVSMSTAPAAITKSFLACARSGFPSTGAAT